MRIWVAMGAVVLAAGCTTVRVGQRDGCWVRETDSMWKVSKQDIGPCVRKEPEWSEDRVERLVQECMVEADYRWENAAMSAWNKGQPLPPRPPEQDVMKQCMADAASPALLENETLKKRVEELTDERDALKSRVEEEVAHMRAAEDKMTDALGEAAKRPSPSAVATSTSNGSATTTDTQHPAAPALAPVTVNVAPGAPPHVQTTGVGVSHAPAPAGNTVKSAGPKPEPPKCPTLTQNVVAEDKAPKPPPPAVPDLGAPPRGN